MRIYFKMNMYRYGLVENSRAMKRPRKSAADDEEDGLESFTLDLDKVVGARNPFLGLGAPDKISSRDNNVYFYSDINENSYFKLNMVLQETIHEMQNMALRFKIPPPPVKLHISSQGGLVFGGLSVVDTIKSSPVEIHSIIDGSAASAATFISVVCHKRYIRKHAFMLIHQMSSGVWGKANEIMDEAENIKRISSVVENIYSNHTSMSKSAIRKLEKHDLWMTPEECLKKGLVDEILG